MKHDDNPPYGFIDALIDALIAVVLVTFAAIVAGALA